MSWKDKKRQVENAIITHSVDLVEVGHESDVLSIVGRLNPEARKSDREGLASLLKWVVKLRNDPPKQLSEDDVIFAGRTIRTKFELFFSW